MTKQTVVLAVIGVLALVGAYKIAKAEMKPAASNFTIRTLEPVDARLATKAETSCWFKVRSRSSRAEEIRLWSGVSSTAATTGRLGQLVIVTGAMEPSVRDDRFYGCSLFEYTQGSPVVMTDMTSPSPVRTDSVVPPGFSADGKQLQ